MRFALALMIALAFPASAQEIRLQDAERIEVGQFEKLRGALPPALWEHRDLLLGDAAAVRIRRDAATDETPVDCTRNDSESPKTSAASVPEEPLDVRGSIVVRYRDSSTSESKEDTSSDTWLFLPARESVRHLEAADRDRLRSDSVAMGGLESFSAVPPQGAAACDDAVQVLVPSRDPGAPADAVQWELRNAWRLEFDRGSGRDEVYVDRASFELLYGFVYDRSDELWKITTRDRDGAEMTFDVQTPRDMPSELGR